ncbi:Aspartyl-tRNA(Asn) amidotransferase subunit C @ Glutamyl-tRNA(Gln) amidotransferase subunit C [hydrothermal vent metagenome]|uniref:Aspartyl-tRNA(Asn) amidotransferase subunit C @ Glutamyl-tRNA(Gln) amidotransferase subunit C n=1 Tax=hydrothermal vent metagenome TaxID=652676 RepID=A0A1W1C861_9ZZZZ
MSLSSEEVQKVAHLARLGISTEESQSFSDQLSKVFDLIDDLEKVKTNGIDPMAHPLGMSQRMREDKVTEDDNRLEFQKIAPKTAQNMYLVPKIID